MNWCTNLAANGLAWSMVSWFWFVRPSFRRLTTTEKHIVRVMWTCWFMIKLKRIA
jgi:hypothetical protein